MNEYWSRAFLFVMQVVAVLDSNISLYERDDAECAWHSFRLFLLPFCHVERSRDISQYFMEQEISSIRSE
jgi:hypothetical protein